MEYRILGPLEVSDDGRELELGSGKQRALLAMLLLHASEVVSADRLIEDLWGEHPPATAAKTLQVHVSRLRKALGEDGRLRSRAGGYVLELAPGQLDLERFERLAEEGRRALAGNDAAGAQELLREALSLWRGPPLAEFAFESFAQREIARLEEIRLAALEQRMEADLVRGRHDELVGELEALVAEHPLRERLRSQLMLALYRSGRQAEALKAYQEARRVFVEELGIEPDRSLRELEKAILQQDRSLDVVTNVEAVEATEAWRGAFVGREAELQQLLGGLGDALAGRGRLFLLVGEPGIGKSRLAEELIVHARSRGAQVLIGRCWEAGGAPAYWPWVQSLRTYVRESDPVALRSQLGAGAADVAQIVPELRQQFPDLPEPPPLDGEGARFRLFDATGAFLRNASRNRPILLVLDDLHAADAPSLLLLQFLARELGSTRMLILGAYRDVDPIPGQPLTAMLAEVAREPVTRRISLGGLNERQVAEYVELSASEIGSPELVTALYTETEGNPLFVGETVRLLALEGVRPEPTGAVITIPQSVRDVIARRLAHLSEECNRVLALASVLGREFSRTALARVSAVSDDHLLETLDEAMAARVVADTSGGVGHLRFAHILIRDTLYEGLTAARRVRLHRLAVEALEALYGADPGPHLAELAHHAIAGSQFEKGLSYARLAGDRAFALLAYEEAARLHETALEALDLADRPDERARCEVLISLGDAKLRAGDSLSAKRVFLEASGIARRLGLARELARAAAGYGGRIAWARAGEDEQLVPLLEEALAGLADEDVELRVRLLARLAGALRDEPSRARRDTLSRKAVELARRTGDPLVLAHALEGRSSVIAAPDTVAECLALGSELRQLGEQIGDRQRAMNGQLDYFIAQVLTGDLSEWQAVFGALSRIAQELRQPAYLWQIYAAQAMMALTEGRLSEAEELVPKAFAFGEHAQPEMAIPVYQLQLYALRDFQGRLEGVEPLIANLVSDYPARPAFRCAHVHLQARLGRLANAKRALDHLAEDDFSALPFDQEWLYAMSLLAETSALLADTHSASTLYRLLLPWATFNAADHPEGIRGSISRYLGLLAMTTELQSQAEQHFEDALEANERMGSRPWLAHTQHDYARMLLARGAARDGANARELLSQALATYREVGMQTYAASASALAREVGTTA